jgi:hypothetical protein
MPEHHEPLEVTAGETWDIPGTLLDANDSPIDLSGATLEWALVDSGNNPVMIPAEVNITDAAAGTICISVEANHTAGLDPGYYHDGLRVTMARGERFTWHGQLLVDADRFTGSGA